MKHGNSNAGEAQAAPPRASHGVGRVFSTQFSGFGGMGMGV